LEGWKRVKEVLKPAVVKPEMKKLIVNADDFGLTEGINKGIIEAFREGIVTSASIMANGESFEHAVSLSQQYPALSIGAHLVLVEEKPVLSPDEVPSLIGKNNKLHKNYKEFLTRFLLGRIKIIDIEKELRAQLEKVLKAGIQIAHIDSHQHLHVYPAILDIVLRLAEEYGIRWIRNAYEHSTASSIGQGGLKILAKKGKQKILNAQTQTTDYFFGAGFSGRMTERELLNVLVKLPAGTSEIMCHPGEDDEKTTTKYSHWGFNWKQERDALLSRTVRQFIEKKEIVLISYADLQKRA
jgi:hopanoid biosynthesis associated protein HpnK